MFFARVRWVGRVLDGAGIDTNSKTGRELSTALLKFSKYGQEKNRRGEGARGARLDLGPAEWAVLGAIFAPEDPRVAEHIAEVLALSESDAEALLARTRDSAIKLAERDLPNLLPPSNGVMATPKKCPLWNWIALLYPLSAFFYVLSIGAPLLVAWTYAVGNLGYLLAVITIYPGQFVLFGLKTRLNVFIIALVAWLNSVVFMSI